MEKKRNTLLILLALWAMLLLALAYALYHAYSEEKRLYEQTNTEQFVIQRTEGERRAEQIRVLREEAAKEETEERMKAALESRCQRYREQLLLLVNPWNPVPEDYTVQLSTVEEGYLIHRRCAQALTDMINDCRAAGNLPVICSAYRTQAYQEELYRNKILRLLAAGVANAEAPKVAARSVAIPGTSEHQLGYAVDIIDELYVNLDQYQQYTSVQQWLMAHCTDYGFVLRYPNGSSDVTGIIFEPWHYRYVGISTAKELEKSGQIFEEYIQTQKETGET